MNRTVASYSGALRKAGGGGGVYIPPDFEPNYRPNLDLQHNTFTPPDAPSDGLRATTANISPYETLPDTESLYTSEFAGEHTGAYVVGGRRNTFAPTFVPGAPAPAPAATPTAPQQGDSTALLKRLYECSMMTGCDNGGTGRFQPSDSVSLAPEQGSVSLAQTQDSAAITPCLGNTSFRGPDIILSSPPQYGSIDDTMFPSIDSAPAWLDSKQPSWPPKFVQKASPLGEPTQPELPHPVPERPSEVEPLPVYSGMTSAECSQSPSPTGCSDAVASDGVCVSEGHGEDAGRRGVAPKSKRGRLRKLFACFA